MVLGRRDGLEAVQTEARIQGGPCGCMQNRESETSGHGHGDGAEGEETKSQSTLRAWVTGLGQKWASERDTLSVEG